MAARLDCLNSGKHHDVFQCVARFRGPTTNAVVGEVPVGHGTLAQRWNYARYIIFESAQIPVNVNFLRREKVGHQRTSHGVITESRQIEG